LRKKLNKKRLIKTHKINYLKLIKDLSNENEQFESPHAFPLINPMESTNDGGEAPSLVDPANQSTTSPTLPLLMDKLNIATTGADSIWPMSAQKVQPPPHSSLDRF
jgi:hypothetical protein